MSKFFVCLIGVSFFGLTSHLGADAGRQLRDFRPIAPIGGVAGEGETGLVPHPSRDSRQATKMGWAYFDREQWDEAREWFLEALGRNAENTEAAEGLVMTIYRAEGARVAYDLSRELEPKVSWLPRMVMEAVEGEVKGYLGEGKLEEANRLLASFPADEKALEAPRADLEEMRSRLSDRARPVRSTAHDGGADLPTAVEYALSQLE